MFDDTEISIECTNCGEEIKKSLAWFEAHRGFACPRCGANITVDTKQFREATKPLEDLKKLFR